MASPWAPAHRDSPQHPADKREALSGLLHAALNVKNLCGHRAQGGPVVTAIALSLAAVVFAANSYATWVVLHDEDETPRRWPQLLVVWALPLFGAAFAIRVHRPSAPGRDPSLDYTPDED